MVHYLKLWIAYVGVCPSIFPFLIMPVRLEQFFSMPSLLSSYLYGKFRPVPIAFERTEVLGKKPFWDNVVGEAGAMLLLKRRIPGTEADESTNGWQGDRWLVYDGGEDGDQLLWRTLWKDELQAELFFSAAKNYLIERYSLERKPEYDQADGSFHVTEPGVRRMYLEHTPGTGEVTLIDAGTEKWLDALRETFL